ncbi:CBS domain-containing protein [Neolewinella litorea]|uniref:CBS domain-containing protein n=1 Tax=Neolewinella litorea TaxID=2562452 RepID=A0A4S4N8C1_9BACT|nr:hypothetical protein [Neolewinella litorea]THH34587.1 hypothetical protein E4021_17265 [Neolewinella litorea]
MSNAEVFIDIYNKIDNLLRKSGQYDADDSFTRKVKQSKNAVVRRYRGRLISMGELRNAIVHNPKIDGKPIADPHDATVREIEKIYNQLSNPKKVIPTFQFDVLGARKDEYINDILIEMKRWSFSQFPVLDENGSVIELINTNTIARWLSSQVEDNGTVIIDEVKVEDFLSEIESPKNYEFISRDTSVFEAYEIFTTHVEKSNRRLDVLFITQSGKPTETLLGLATIEDVASEVISAS